MVGWRENGAESGAWGGWGAGLTPGQREGRSGGERISDSVHLKNLAVPWGAAHRQRPWLPGTGLPITRSLRGKQPVGSVTTARAP